MADGIVQLVGWYGRKLGRFYLPIWQQAVLNALAAPFL